MSDRKLSTRIDNSKSDFGNVCFGVPQGSVLGPLLFLIYVNDIEEIVENSFIFLFADDIILISIDPNYNKMIQNLQKDFDQINLWFALNEVFISESKTQFITIRSCHARISEKKNIYLHDCTCSTLNCHKTCIKINEVEEAKYLGFIINGPAKCTLRT